MDKEILVEWNTHWKEEAGLKLVERELVKEIEQWLERKEILGFIGVRRSGKTTLMSFLISRLSTTIPQKNILFVKCDDDRVQKENLIDDAIKRYRELINPECKILIDEVQALDAKWFNCGDCSDEFRCVSAKTKVECTSCHSGNVNKQYKEE